MNNYKEEIIDGQITKWRRADRIQINNAYGQVPNIVFTEIEQTSLPDGQQIRKQTDSLRSLFDNPTGEFDLLNPETGDVIGVGQYQDMYVMLYSLYMKLAEERDVRVAEEILAMEAAKAEALAGIQP